MRQPRLAGPEREALDSLIQKGQITRDHLPRNGAIAVDSMGPLRDPNTDELFPGTITALRELRPTLRRHRLAFIVATNGPLKEGEDPLEILGQGFATVEGGGIALSMDPRTNELKKVQTADPGEVEKLSILEQAVTKHPLMHTLLEDRNPQFGKIPMRTHYETGIVLTLPATFGDFQERLKTAGVDPSKFGLDLNGSNYVKEMLGFALGQLEGGIENLGFQNALKAFMKAQNRRVYTSTRHLADGSELDKQSGVFLGMSSFDKNKWYHPEGYAIQDSIYIADRLTDSTQVEGQRVLSAAERSMVRAGFFSNTPLDTEFNIVDRFRLDPNTPYPIYGSATSRLAIDVTMDNSLPRVSLVEGAYILTAPSGIAAFKYLGYLYDQLHPSQR